MTKMKKIFLIVLLVSAYVFAGAQTKTIWTCPMHPQIQRSGPGSCPICGMTLVKKTIKVSKPKAAPKKQVTEKPKMAVPSKNETQVKDTIRKTEMSTEDHKMETDSTEGNVADQIQSKVY